MENVVVRTLRKKQWHNEDNDNGLSSVLRRSRYYDQTRSVFLPLRQGAAVQQCSSAAVRPFEHETIVHNPHAVVL